MSDQALNILKYFLLALVWLFFLYILRVVWVEIRSSEEGAAPTGSGSVAESPGAIPATRGPGTRGARVRRGGTRGAPVVAPAPTPPPAARASPPSRLRVLEPAEMAGRTFPLDGALVGAETVIGRSTDAGVPLPGDSFVSSHHARLFTRDGRLWVEDTGSTNGTYVNSARITSATPLQAGDRFQVGRTVFEVGA